MTEPQEIRVTGFIIHARGDSSVGIPDSDWTLSGDFFFDAKEDLEDFRKRLEDLFADQADSKPGVSTFEEHQAFLDIEDELWSKHPEAEPPPPLDLIQQKAHDLFPDSKEDGWEQRREKRLLRAGAMKALRKLQEVDQHGS